MSAKNSEKMFITFWGTRGSISTPGISTEKYGGNTSCVSVHQGNTRIVLDAGTGIRNYGLSLASETGSTGNIHLLLSHTHWDHIQGLPFFGPVYTPGTMLSIYGSPQKGTFLESILQGQMDINYFPVQMNALAADISIIEMSADELVIGKMNIQWQEQVCHPGGSLRYSLTCDNRKIVYATDVELNLIFKDCQSEEEKQMASQYIDFIRKADLLIADGQYLKEEYESKHGFGHSSLEVITAIAYEAEVKQLAIFHHDPQRSDTMIDSLSGEFSSRFAEKSRPMNIFWAREGMTLAV